ncbi:TPA: hypothetical protein ACFNMX_000731 [Neisseria lactamica]
MPSEAVFGFQTAFSPIGTGCRGLPAFDFAEVAGTQFGGGGNLWKIDLQKSLRIFLVLPNLFPKQKMRFPTNPPVITIAGGNWKS